MHLSVFVVVLISPCHTVYVLYHFLCTHNNNKVRRLHIFIHRKKISSLRPTDSSNDYGGQEIVFGYQMEVILDKTPRNLRNVGIITALKGL